MNDPNVPNVSKRRRWTTALLLALPLAAGGAATAFAQPPHGWGGGPGAMHEHMQRHMGKLLDEVGATAQQKAQIKAIWDQAKPQLQAFHEQQRQLHEQLRAAMTAPTIDTATIEKLRRDGVQLMDKQSSVVTQAFVGSAQVLSPDQRKQLGEKLEKHGPRFGGPDAE
jgi:Spy/CpxP family protein refolding chaperone